MRYGDTGCATGHWMRYGTLDGLPGQHVAEDGDKHRHETGKYKGR